MKINSDGQFRCNEKKKKIAETEKKWMRGKYRTTLSPSLANINAVFLRAD